MLGVRAIYSLSIVVRMGTFPAVQGAGAEWLYMMQVLASIKKGKPLVQYWKSFKASVTFVRSHCDRPALVAQSDITCRHCEDLLA